MRYLFFLDLKDLNIFLIDNIINKNNDFISINNKLFELVLNFFKIIFSSLFFFKSKIIMFL